MADSESTTTGTGPSDLAAAKPQTAERQRFRKLAQAALNADVTVDQLQTIIDDVGTTLGGMDRTLIGLDDTLRRFGATLDSVDATVARMTVVVDRMERITGRLESIVDIVELAVKPIGTLEAAGRGIATRLGLLR